MATYCDIQDWVRDQYGFVPKTCWIAHCKELNGVPVRKAPNRRTEERMVPCPDKGRDAIEAAFRHFGLLT